MLERLSVRDFAVIAQLDLEFAPGLTVFSGETGAGKSILVGAIALMLGARAKRGLIRDGAKRAEVVLEARPPAQLQTWLAEHDHDTETFLLRRVLRADGSSRAYINDTPVSLKALGEAAALLIEIHGQHEHQKLTDRSQQRTLLDAACNHSKALDTLAESHSRYQTLHQHLSEARSGQAEREAELATVTQHLEELDALAPVEGEYEELDALQRAAASSADRLTACATVISQLRDDEERALVAQLAQLSATAAEHAEHAPGLKTASDLLEQARICLDEAADAATDERDRSDLDPARAAEIEQRLQGFFDCARRHNVPPGHVWQTALDLRARKETLDSLTQDPAALAAELAAVEGDYRKQAAALSAKRTKTATAIAKKATGLLHKLGMPQATFTITVTHDAARAPSAHGCDDIVFAIATAPGQTPGPIAELASGGELSRLSLTLRLVLRSDDAPPVMIFDEVDTGIGGGPAEQVGQMLADLAASAQVLCITHLPQVAVCGHAHFCVRKQADTGTTISVLGTDERVGEVARMFSGIEKMDTAQEHARALLDHAAERKSA